MYAVPVNPATPASIAGPQQHIVEPRAAIIPELIKRLLFQFILIEF
jgi:hypothetical protein